MQEHSHRFGLSASALRLLAMLFMLLESYVELILTGRTEEYLNTVREGQSF